MKNELHRVVYFFQQDVADRTDV